MKTRFADVRWLFIFAGLWLAAGCGRRPAVESRPAPRVLTGRVVSREFLDAVRVQGVVRATHSIRVAALAPGVIEEMWVEEGQAVTNGQALFQTDRVNLERQRLMREEDLKVAEAGAREATVLMEKAAVVSDKAERDAVRIKALYEGGGAVTLDFHEKAEMQRRLAAADLEHARAAGALAAARQEQARTAVDMAAKLLADSTIRAPLSGVVTRKLLDRGDYAAGGAAVLEVENPGRLELAVRLAGEHFARIEPGRTHVRMLGGAAAGTEYPVTYRAPGVHPVTRTVEVRALLDGAGGWAPGMMAEVLVVFDRRNAPAVPASAVALRGGESVVFVVENGHAVRRPVRTGLTWDGQVELLTPPGDVAVVLEGQSLLNDGDAVEAGEAAARSRRSEP